MKTIETEQFISEAFNDETAVNQYNEGKIRFDSLAGFWFGRSLYITLRCVARSHGYVKQVLEIALDEYEKKVNEHGERS